MKVYLCGPMSGIPEFNFPAFHAATKQLRDKGFKVFNPAERDLEDGFNPKTDKANTFLHYMKYDLPAVMDSDAVVVLPGWENSKGAKLETHVARECGIILYTLEDAMSITLT